jgi:hypothetical protein
LKFRQPFNLWSKGLDQIGKNFDTTQPALSKVQKYSLLGKHSKIFCFRKILQVLERAGCPKGDSARAKRVPIWFLAILAIVFLSFLFFLPLTYGFPLTEKSLQSRMWLPSWSL